MLKNCTTALFLSVFTILFTTNSFAQAKIAYINMQQLVTGMPEAKRAYDTLQVYQQELAKDGQALIGEFQQMAAKFEVDAPTLKPDIKDLRVKQLETAKANIEEYRERMEQKLTAREQELTAPILAKAKKAVSDLATEKGYVCVLDSSKDIIVTATCDDLLPAARQKLGIK